MKAIMLAGGLGTRLQQVVNHLPKPMAPIQGKPFLAHLLLYLKQQGISGVILSVHHLKESIQDYFQHQYAGLAIDYAIEDELLGTGGAICLALKKIAADQSVFILNGDTFVRLNYQAMYRQHHQNQANLTIALCKVEDCQRYGRVIMANHRITSFQEKGTSGSGYINAGVYLLSPKALHNYKLARKFSWEKDFLYPYTPIIQPHYFLTDDYFIDIGVPEDYARANVELGL